MSGPSNKKNPGKKIRVAVLYGGRSGEHEVSLRSAASVIKNLDRDRFEIVPIGVDKDGRWHLNDISLIEAQKPDSLPLMKKDWVTLLPASADSSSHEHGLIPLSPGSATQAAGRPKGVDVVFPVMHGTYCEDGTIQGFLELADIPYVGCGVLASALGMDKEMAKRLVRDAGIPIVPYVTVKKERWAREQSQISTRIAKELGFPCFVKPANAGSSVGVHKVKEPSQLAAAMEDAFRYDLKILVEKAIPAREIEVSVLENSDPAGEPLVSIPGEINPTHEFYSYEAKYLDDNGATLIIPAKLSPEQVATVQKIGREAFKALEGEGMARVDLFLDRNTGELYFNEVNTIPGFTSISMYPKMWEASGLGYKELLSKLIDLAIARQERKSALVRDFTK